MNHNHNIKTERVLQIATQDEELRTLYSNAIIKNKSNNMNKYRDSGFDLYIPDEYIFTTNELVLGHTIDHKVQCCLKEIYISNEDDSEKIIGEKYLGYYLYPRSSISKTPFRLSNSVGIIDSGYRGNLIAKVDYFGTKQIDNCVNNIKIEKHSRLFQICSGDLLPFDNIELYYELNDSNNTVRGSGGFGSTGL